MTWLSRWLRRAGNTWARRTAKQVEDGLRSVAETELERGRASERMRAEREAQAAAALSAHVERDRHE